MGWRLEPVCSVRKFAKVLRVFEMNGGFNGYGRGITVGYRSGGLFKMIVFFHDSDYLMSEVGRRKLEPERVKVSLKFREIGVDLF